MEVRSTQTTLFPEEDLVGIETECDTVLRASDSFVTVVPVNLDPKNLVLHDSNPKSNSCNNNNNRNHRNYDQSRQQTNGFVTVVQVGGGRSVTEGEEGVRVDIEGEGEEEEEKEVLEDEVTVFRLPGERLGMGLQFEGGTEEQHLIRTLYIQSVAGGSPTARTRSKWGHLEEGDQILKIDDRDVAQLTRSECVSALRNAPVAVRLLVRHRKGPKEATDADKQVLVALGVGAGKDMECKPPPVPPRRTKGLKVASPVSTAVDQDTSDKGHPEEHLSETCCALPGEDEEGGIVVVEEEEEEEVPVQADVYVDLIAEEDMRSVGGEYESDDTASSASTVIDGRFGNLEVAACSTLAAMLQDKGCIPSDTAFQSLDGPKQLGPFVELDVLEPPQCFQDQWSVDLPLPLTLPAPVAVAVPKPRQRPPVPARLGKKVVKTAECPAKPPRLGVPRAPSNQTSDASWQELTSDDHLNEQQEVAQLVNHLVSHPHPPPPTFADSDVPFEPDCDSVTGNSDTGALRCVGGAEGGVGEPPRVATCEVIAVIEKMSVVAGRHNVGVGGRRQSTDMPSSAMTTTTKALLIDAGEDPFAACSRLPPDGHEFPPNYQESLNGPNTAMPMSLMDLDLDMDMGDTAAVLKPPWGFEDRLNNPPTPPPPLPTVAPPPMTSRNADQRANLSVRDKIAMFASLEDVSGVGAVKDKEKEKEDTGYSSWDKDRDTLGPNLPPPPSKPEFQHWRSVTNLVVQDRPESSLSTSSTLSRSSDDLGGRYTCKMSMYPNTSSSDDADQDPTGSAQDKQKKLIQRRSLYSLMESRTQAVSKLRGLVIPNAPRDGNETAVEHLPTIVTAFQMSLAPKTDFKSTLQMTPAPVVTNRDKDPTPPPPRPAPRTNAVLRKSSESIDTVAMPTSAPVAPPRVAVGKADRPQLERTVSAPQIDSDAEDSVRILKANSVEAINRMNVLRSAKTSSGARVALVDISIEDPPAALPRAAEAPRQERGEDVKVATIHVVVDSDEEKEEEEEEDEEVLTTVPHSPNSSEDEGLDVKTPPAIDNTCNQEESVAIAAPVQKAPVSSERWSQLEEKYGSKTSQEKHRGDKVPTSTPYTLPRNLSGPGTGTGSGAGTGSGTGNEGKNFRAIADKWQERTTNVGAQTLPRTSGAPWKPESKVPAVAERKLSAPATTTNSVVPVATARVTLRDKSNRVPRPASMVENVSDRKLKAWDPANNSVTSYLGGGGAARRANNAPRATSFGDLRQVFEKQESSSAPSVNFRVFRRVGENTEPQLSNGNGNGNNNFNRNNNNNNNNHTRMSSLDSTASGDSDAPAQYGSVNCSPSAMDHYGSVTSLSSSTSLISTQELQQLIDEANQSLEESGSQSCQEVMVVVLQRETLGGSVGVTLAGGADYDSKEITVNKIIKGGLAERDGRIQHGDRVISVNGKNLRGVTHKEALNILKAPRADCVLVLSRNRTTANGTEDVGAKSRDSVSAHKHKVAVDAPIIATETCTEASKAVTVVSNGKREVCLDIVKDGSGLGFSLEGGKQSPLGDKPLTVKKIFSDKGGVLKVGDEILSINDMDATKMARSEAWNFMRKLPDGIVKLVVRQSS